MKRSPLGPPLGVDVWRPLAAPVEGRRCSVPGCDEPRYRSPSGEARAVCAAHHAEESRRWRARQPHVRRLGDCASCRITFVKVRPWQRFCGVACRNVSRRLPAVERSCLRCRSMFTTAIQRQRYCSRKCSHDAANGRWRARLRASVGAQGAKRTSVSTSTPTIAPERPLSRRKDL